MKNLKKWLTVIAACLVVLMLAGCPSEGGHQPGGIPSGPNNPNNSQQQYTVTFRLPAEADPMSGPGGDSYYSQDMVNAGAKATRPANNPNVSGYVFVGWYTDTSYTTEFDFNTSINADTTIYAKMVRGVAVTFNTNATGANFPADQASMSRGGPTLTKTIARGSTVTRPTDPTYLGYTLAGWYTESSCTNRFNFTTPVNADITLYAKWVIGYPVTFETNGGSSIEDQVVTEGNTATRPTDPTKAGYTFVNWYSDSGLTTVFNFSTIINSTTTIYAKWNLAPLSVGNGLVVINADSANNISAMYACDHEVTMEEFKNVFNDFTFTSGREKRPFNVGCLYKAVVYCNRLSLIEGLEPCYTINGMTEYNWRNIAYNDIPTTGTAAWNNVTCDFTKNGYRLPTEAEWLYLAKGGENYTYSGSNTWQDVAWFNSNSSGRTHDVKTKSPNGFGIYDMSGNLAEVTWKDSSNETWAYGGDYNHSNVALTSRGNENKFAPRSEATFRVVRTKTE